jgi:hypothetical protein
MARFTKWNLGRAQTKDHLNWYLFRTICFLGLGSFNFGYPAAVIGTLLGKHSCVDRGNY